MVARQAQSADLVFRRMFAASPTAFLVLSPDAPRFTITEVNDAYLAATMTTRGGLLGRGVFEAFPDNPDDAGADGVGKVQASLARVLATRAPDAMPVQKYDIADPAGAFEERWWNPVNTPVLDEQGEVAAIIHHTVDVTEARRAEAAARRADDEHIRSQSALRESEARFRGAVQAVQGVLWTNDAEGRMKGEQPGWAALTGQSLEEYQDFGWARAVHPDDAEATTKAWLAAVAARTTFVHEHRVRRAPDGAWRVFSIRAIPALAADGSLREWVGVHTDVTEQRNAEAALRKSEARLRALNADLERQVIERSHERGRTWQVTPDLLCVINLEDGRFERTNPAWQATLGWPPEEIDGRPYVDFLHPDDLERSHAAFEQVRRGDPVLRFDNRYRRKSGGYRWLSWTAVPEGGKLYSVCRDVTDEVAKAAALAQAEDALRHAQKMEAVGQLTGGVAHDFNNLLTIIKSSAEFLRRPDLADERRRRYVDAIADTVDRAAKLTGQLLAFARRQTLMPEAFDVAQRIEAIGEMLGTIVGSRIRIVTEGPEERCVVRADASQFETAVVNMAVNARDAMNGEGALTLKVAAVSAMPPIRSHAGALGRFVALSLTDTGGGIPAERLRQIFEPFFTTKEVGKGTGLGLSQVYGFAKQSGGDVSVTSDVGRGTTFTLYLPRKDAEDLAASAVPPAAAPNEHGQGRRVLVVEDNVEVGRFSTEILQDLGYETIWAANGDEALEILDEANGFDAVFSDVVMPGMSGVELGQEIRRRHPRLPVVLASGYSHVLVEEGRHGFELLQKPYAAEDLSRVLHRVISERPASDGAAG